MRRVLSVPVLAMLAAVLLPACGSVDIAFPAKTKLPGRYAIVSPQKEIFLLDSATGSTWLLVYDDGSARWKPIASFGERGAPPVAAKPEPSAGVGDNASR